MQELYSVIQDRKDSMNANSYTVDLLNQGVERIGQKVVEEAGETAIAAALVTGQIGGSIQAASELIWRLRNTKSAGRLVVDIDPINIDR